MKEVKSPNYDDRTSENIKYLILHYTGMATGYEALERLCSEEAKVSAHYLIEENGEIFSLVEEEKRAWHAGISKWEDDVGLNDLSIGIEIVNTGHPYPGYESVYKPFPEMQMQSVISLSKEIIKRHQIKPCHVLGHSDIAWRRKIDPGELFDWERLSFEGIGIWVNVDQDTLTDKVSESEFLNNLSKYGYDIGETETDLKEIATAFQRHFRPKNIDGNIDRETYTILEKLLLKKFS